MCLDGGDLPMPQPLSQFPKVLMFSLAISPPDFLKDYPNLAGLIAQVIVSWGNVETFMLSLFVELLGGDKELAADIFLALEIQSAKSAAINTAAQKLPDDQQSVLRAILAIQKTNQKSRDKIAHWTWGHSPQIEDGLLLTNPKNRAMERQARDQIFIYKKEDLEKIIQANDRLCGYAQQFMFVIGSHPLALEGQLFAKLCAEPEIRERLDRQASPD